LQPAHILRKD